MYTHWVFDSLVRIRQDMSIEPRLAKRWERIDDLTMRFHLRKGVKFHSGNPFTATDVKFTIERLFGIRVDDLLSVDGKVRSPMMVYRKVQVAGSGVLSDSENR